MVIRKPVAQVFEAFLNPATITQFWLSRSSGRLETGKQVQWSWDTYDISFPVTATTIELNRRIVLRWPGVNETTTVTLTFAPQSDSTTFVEIAESGFSGGGDELVHQLANSVEGFALVLASLKALLEHRTVLTAVADRYPKGIDRRAHLRRWR
ncbi:MAG TPA: SRPBCC family protein [Gemmatimonadales bacterium]